MAPDEEILLLEHSFLSHVPEAFVNVPSYRDPLETIPSAASMNHALWALYSDLPGADVAGALSLGDP